PIFEYAAIAYWDDLITSCTNCGVYTSVSGSAPNRIFNLEWRAQVLSNSTAANFEIRMYESENRFDFVYGTVVAAGNGATIGVQRDGVTATEYACDMPGSVTPGFMLTFTAPACPTVTPTATLPPILPTSTNTPVEPTSTPAEPTPCTVTFTDVENDNTFYANIRCLACRGIMSGYSDGSFRPNNNVTRGQLSKIVANSADFNEPVTTVTFQDVPADSTFYLFIERMAGRGIISGYPCGSTGETCVPPANKPYFRPNANATRGQISKIVSEARGINDTVTTVTFQDVPANSTFWLWIERLANRGYMGGYPCGSPGEDCVPPSNKPYFRPNANATRGQTSKIVANTFYPNCETP
ncbi:MAG TPA: S-layer homology domain-containing protein, partial [Chloroflexia bacterium]|nr:S-layer homology domain-containing protein [Chloroflexia bacterium]